MCVWWLQPVPSCLKPFKHDSSPTTMTSFTCHFTYPFKIPFYLRYAFSWSSPKVLFNSLCNLFFQSVLSNPFFMKSLKHLVPKCPHKDFFQASLTLFSPKCTLKVFSQHVSFNLLPHPCANKSGFPSQSLASLVN